MQSLLRQQFGGNKKRHMWNLSHPFVFILPQWQINWASPVSWVTGSLNKDEASNTSLLLKSQFFLLKWAANLFGRWWVLINRFFKLRTQFLNFQMCWLQESIVNGNGVRLRSHSVAAVGTDRFPKEINYISFSIYCLLYSLLILLCWLLVVDFSVAWFPLNHNSFCKC